MDQSGSNGEGLIQAQRLSSGFVILEAYREFKEGVDSMKMLEQRPGPPQLHWWGKTGALVDISNGIMKDSRVFRIDSDDWIEKYNKEGGANTVKDQALQRLKREGWHSVRPALATTVRAWIMCGFMAITITKRATVAMEYYSRVIDILEWGRRTWANVPKIDRGVIFELSFIRGAKRLRLNALHEILASKVKDSHYIRENLVEWCRDLIAETDANPPAQGTEIDPSTILAFWVYPKGDALAILGWHHMQLGLAAEDAEDANAKFTESARYYIKAAHTFPEDDEKRPYYLKVAIEAYWFQNKPLDDVLLLTAGISHCFPKVLGLWEHSATMKEMAQNVVQAFEFAFICREAIDKGEISMKDIVKPKSLKRTDRWATPAVKYV
ncbi:unnamed protein product [Cyclocybe aegerita]|uniref:Uncharacterized protein n=1 Tax=Cyclocybe aegerita TaxID=1973307 RepID=A0A8S0VT32_CYCAE|nr:unnamed protein product [Cyclocybe aegerita]